MAEDPDQVATFLMKNKIFPSLGIVFGVPMFLGALSAPNGISAFDNGASA